MVALRRTLAASVAVGVVAAVVGEQLYRRRLRERTLTWGATAEEAARSLPGDGLLAEADIVATRAITIGAPASAVWPWLVQMGPGRAGAYTYDWVENLFGLTRTALIGPIPSGRTSRWEKCCEAAKASGACGSRSSSRSERS